MPDTFPMRIVQAVSFTTAFAISRTVAGTRLYSGHWGGSEGNEVGTGQAVGLTVIMVVLYIVQSLLQAECVIKCSKILAFPPFFDSENRALAEKCARVYSDAVDNDFKMASEALGISMSFLRDTLMDEYKKNHQDATRTSISTPNPAEMSVEVEGHVGNV